MDRQTDKQRDRQTDAQTDRQADRQTDDGHQCIELLLYLKNVSYKYKIGNWMHKRSSAIGMSHTCLCLPSRSWYSFADPGGMEG